MNSVMGYISVGLAAFDLAFGAFVASAPAGAIPWWVVSALAAANAVVHFLPSPNISFTAPKKE